MLRLDSAEPPGPLHLYPRIVFDAAFLGYGHRAGDPTPIAIYDFHACVTAASRWFDLPEPAAIDYVSNQCEGAWLGPSTPLLLHSCHPTELPA